MQLIFKSSHFWLMLLVITRLVSFLRHIAYYMT